MFDLRLTITNQRAVEALAEAGALAERLADDSPWIEDLQTLQALIEEVGTQLELTDDSDGIEPERDVVSDDQRNEW